MSSQTTCTLTSTGQVGIGVHVFEMMLGDYPTTNITLTYADGSSVYREASNMNSPPLCKVMLQFSVESKWFKHIKYTFWWSDTTGPIVWLIWPDSHKTKVTGEFKCYLATLPLSQNIILQEYSCYSYDNKVLDITLLYHIVMYILFDIFLQFTYCINLKHSSLIL